MAQLAFDAFTKAEKQQWESERVEPLDVIGLRRRVARQLRDAAQSTATYFVGHVLTWRSLAQLQPALKTIAFRTALDASGSAVSFPMSSSRFGSAG